MDCCTLVCDFAKKVSGFDPMRNYRGRYSTHEGAIAIMGSSIADFVSANVEELGFREIPHGKAPNGSIAAVRYRDVGGSVLGLIYGPNVFICLRGGVHGIGRSNVFKAWEFGKELVRWQP